MFAPLGDYHVRVALCVADGESTLRPWAVHWEDNGSVSVGLFGLNTGGVGGGYSVEQLKDPWLNTQLAANKVTADGWAQAWASTFWGCA